MPVAGGPATQYVQIADFSPGILTTYAGSDGSSPNRPDPEAQASYAQEDGTWGCYGHPAGGLHPLPSITHRYRIPMSQGYCVNSWSILNGGTANTEGDDPDELDYLYQPDEYIVATHILTPVSSNPWPTHSNSPGLVRGEGRDPVPDPQPDTLSFSTQRSATGLHNLDDPTPYINVRVYTRWRQLRLSPKQFDFTAEPPLEGLDEPYKKYVIISQWGGLLAGWPNGAWWTVGETPQKVQFRKDFHWPQLYYATLTDATSGTLYDKSTDTFYGRGYTRAGVYVEMPGYLPGNRGIIWGSGAPLPFLDLGFSGLPVFVWPSIFYRRNGEEVGENMRSDIPYQLPPIPYGDQASYVGYIAINHQNRYVTCSQLQQVDNLSSPHPGSGGDIGTQRFLTADSWYYSNANSLADSTETWDRPYWLTSPVTRFGAASTGFGAAASMNASELYLVRQTGGGTVVRGALPYGQVTDYPGIPSTHGASNIPTVTPLGLVYGTRDGVYAWRGADEAQPLSSQLEGWFWKPGDGSTDGNSYGLSHGKFAYSHPFVFVPNNWVYDTRTGGWFRLTPPERVAYKDYNVSANGAVYASPGKFNHASERLVAERYDLTRGAHEYQWVSQALPVSVGRVTQFSEVNVVAAGHGTFSVTVSGIDGATSTARFDVDSDEPVALSGKVSVKTWDAVVTIAAQGTPSPVPGPFDQYELAPPDDSPAPTIYRMSLGVNTLQSAPMSH